MRTKALGAIVFLGVVLLPGLCFAQSLSGPNQCEGGLGHAVAYFHPGPNKCGSGSGYVGPGDAAVVAGLGNATDFGSCTYAYNKAYATGFNPACSLTTSGWKHMHGADRQKWIGRYLGGHSLHRDRTNRHHGRIDGHAILCINDLLR